MSGVGKLCPPAQQTPWLWHREGTLGDAESLGHDYQMQVMVVCECIMAAPQLRTDSMHAALNHRLPTHSCSTCKGWQAPGWSRWCP